MNRGRTTTLRSRGTGAALATVVALGSVLAARDARAFCRTTTIRSSTPGECSSEGVPLAWQAPCVGLSVHRAGSPEIGFDVLVSEVAQAGERWHAAPCDANATTQPHLHLTRIGDTITPTGYNPTGTNANTISFNDVWRLDRSHRLGTIAITIVSYDRETGEIFDGDIELNQRSEQNPDGFLFTTGIPDSTSADLPTILTHEIGHLQGISHSAEATAVMWFEAGLGEQRRNLRVDDTQAICDAYPPSSAPDRTCNAVPYGGFASNPFGGRVSGTCAVSYGARPGTNRVALALSALVAAVAIARRRLRGRRAE